MLKKGWRHSPVCSLGRLSEFLSQPQGSEYGRTKQYLLTMDELATSLWTDCSCATEFGMLSIVSSLSGNSAITTAAEAMNIMQITGLD
jgi:hypothetical protein